MQGPEPATQQDPATAGRAPMMGDGRTTKASSGPFAGPLGIVLFLILFATAAYLSYRTLVTPEPVAPEPVSRVFYCVEAKKPFEYSLTVGESWPVESPYTHKKTGYPAEKCFWTRDGKRKSEPTYVILNEYLGKKGDTICPDCGRVVIGHNPSPPATVPSADGK